MSFVVGLSSGLQSVSGILLKIDNGKFEQVGQVSEFMTPARREDINDQTARLQLCLNQLLAVNDIDVSQILAIGVSHPSQVDSKSGKIIFNAALNLRDFDLVNAFRLRLEHSKQPSIPSFLIRDVSAMALAERELGAGKGKDFENLIYVYVDFSIGSAFILNNGLYEGHRSVAGEFGNLIVRPRGEEGNSGLRGVVEAYSSRTAIAREIYRNARRLGILDFITGIANINEDNAAERMSIDLLKTAWKQEKVVGQIFDDAAEVLGLGVANLIQLLNPQAIIFGGELIEGIDTFRDNVINLAENNSLRANIEGVQFEKASLTPNAESFGGAVFAGRHALAMNAKAPKRHSTIT